MTYKDLIELDADAEMIDLGVASLETEGDAGFTSETGDSLPDAAH